MPRFVVLGGTGKAGRRLLSELTARAQTAVPASRNSPTRFDWHDPDTWAGAVDAADGVFIIGPGSANDWSGRLSDFLDTAAAAGLRHAVLLSARGVEFLPDGAVGRAERALSAGPVPWTILRPSHFAQNFTEAMFAPVDGTILAPVGAGLEPFIDVLDIAQVAAQVLADYSFTGQTIDLSGPEALAFDQAAAVLGEVSGRPVRFADEDRETHVARLRSAGTPEGYVRWRMAMLDGIRSGADAYLSDGVELALGRPATTFTAWARREVPEAAWARGHAV